MTDRAFRAKLYLKAISALNNKLKVNALEQEALYNKAQGCGSITIGEKVQTSRHDDVMAQAIAELTDLKAKYAEMLEEYLRLRRQAGIIIDQMGDHRHSNVLRLKYCAGKTFEEIAEQLHYSTDHVKRLHRDALDNFGEIMEKMPPNAT